MGLYLLFYDVVDDYVARRSEFRELHLGHADEAYERGELLLGGALADPVDGAVLVFRGHGPEVAADFARSDPYVKNGLVTGWRVRAWTEVVAREGGPAGAGEDGRGGGTARVWRGVAAPGNEDAYQRHLEEEVLAPLDDLPGYRGARVLRRTVSNGTEFLVTTLWDSLEAVKAFAGPDPERAVVAPEARALLAEVDERARHYDVV